MTCRLVYIFYAVSEFNCEAFHHSYRTYFSIFFLCGFCLRLFDFVFILFFGALLHAHIHFVSVPPTPLFSPANLFTIESAIEPTSHCRNIREKIIMYVCRWFTHQPGKASGLIPTFFFHSTVRACSRLDTMSNQQELIKPFFLLYVRPLISCSFLLRRFLWASSSSLIFFRLKATRHELNFISLSCVLTQQWVSNFIIYFYIHNLFCLRRRRSYSSGFTPSPCLPRELAWPALSHFDVFISFSAKAKSSNGQSMVVDSHTSRRITVLT